MNRFDLKYFCKKQNYDYPQARIWLMLNVRKFTFHLPIVNVNSDRMSQFEKIVIEGSSILFDIKEISNKNKCLQYVKFLIKKELKNIAFLSSQSNIFKNDFLELKALLDENENINRQIKSISEIRNNEKSHQLNELQLTKAKNLLNIDILRNTNDNFVDYEIEIKYAYLRLEELHEIRDKLNLSIPILPNVIKTPINVPIKKIETQNKVVNQKKQKVKNIQTIVNELATPKVKIENEIVIIDWENVTFKNEHVLLKSKNSSYLKYQVKGSRISFNDIKKMYKSRNAPPLLISVSGNFITKILNIEVLFYYLMFFENTGTIFKKSNSIVNVIEKYRAYNKSYYTNHLKQLFYSECFNYLIEQSSENLPIIPIPEKVKNSSGTAYIHDSFLFPISYNGKNSWIWESSEVSKATYIFETTSTDFVDEIQIIYDFLTGDNNNKRLSLIRKEIQTDLIPLKKRINHSDFNKWKNELESYFITRRNLQ